jgi:tetratricopeptide (TPR) repeat protein
MRRLRLFLILLLWLIALGPEAAEGLSPGIYHVLTDIRERMDAGAYAESIRRLEKLERESASDAYSLAIVRQHLGYAHLGRDDYAAAYRSFRDAAESKALPSEVSRELHRVLAQLGVQLGKPKQAAKYLQSWLRDQKRLKPADHALAAQVFYAAGKVKTAISHLEQAVAATARPEKVWLNSLLAMYLETKRYKKARSLLQRLIARDPGEAYYWQQLAQLHMQRNKPAEALAVLALAYGNGLLQAKDLTRFASLHAHAGMPEKAARLLGKWRKAGRLRNTLKLLLTEADLWLMARERERALGVLRLARKHGDDGRVALKEARILFQDGHWADAAEAFQQALKAGHLDDAAQVRLLLGVSAFRAGDTRLAEAVLEQAVADKKIGGQAKQWLLALRQDAERGE